MLHVSKHKNNNLLAGKFPFTILTLKQMIPSCKRMQNDRCMNLIRIKCSLYLASHSTTTSWFWSYEYEESWSLETLKRSQTISTLSSLFWGWASCWLWQRSNSLSGIELWEASWCFLFFPLSWVASQWGKFLTQDYMKSIINNMQHKSYNLEFYQLDNCRKRSFKYSHNKLYDGNNVECFSGSH